MSGIEVLKNSVKERNHNTDRLIIFINLYSYLFYRKNIHLFRRFDNLYIDGIGLIYMLKLTGIKVNRSSFDMTSLAPIVFNECITKNKKIYFIGSTEEAIQQFIKVIEGAFPGLNIIGYRNGYFTDKTERENSLKHITKLNPDVVVVGMGTPHQEQFLIDLKNTGWKGTGYTCGGFIHQTAKGINYYPDFYNKYNLRWLYRMIDEPKLIKRYLILYPKAILLFLYDIISYKLKAI
ncbi:WecB/TagA/CpsF family glycosyltransferase [Sinomicrobium sp. M5D2P9]